jgi:regulator of protease activity HflC (stomatin/prohibitin superfamily)
MTYAALIQPVIWAMFGGVAAFFVVQALRYRKDASLVKQALRRAALSLLASFLIVPAIAVVPAGFRGVVYQWNGGVQQTPRGEGVSFLVPWLQHLTVMSVRTQKLYSDKVFAQSADLQEITVVASVNYHVDPLRAPSLYQRVGLQYASTVIQPALYQRTKAAVGQIQAIDFAKERDALALTIQGQLTDQLKGYGIVVDYVNIEDAIFDPAFVGAVKAKIIAHQQALQQENLIAAKRAIKAQTIINAEASARSVLIKATAQAKANKLVAASVTPVLLSWQYLVRWNGTLPSTLVGSGQTPSLFLNVPSATSTYGP